MSADWEVGDLALCVLTSKRPNTQGHGQRKVRKGGIYTVERAFVWKGLYWCIVLQGAHSSHWTKSYDARAFVKVTPPKADAFDLETINLMNPKPVEAVR